MKRRFNIAFFREGCVGKSSLELPLILRGRYVDESSLELYIYL